ncbi:MAG: SH3 domain-containing protein [Pseudomonadota bacterium]
MWRLMIVTFGVLALVFFELSGGAEYAPIENSLQRQGIGPHLQDSAVAAADPESVPQAKDEDRIANQKKRVETTLAALTATQSADPADHTQALKTHALIHDPEIPDLGPDADDAAVIEALKDAGAQMKTEWPGAIELFARRDEALGVQERTPKLQQKQRDLRLVRGDLANMRGGPGTEYEKIAALTQGTEVVVLFASGNGWLELQVVESGQIGWMADWLVSAKANTTGFAGAAASRVNAE